ncbi:MAG: hypothetical protein J7L64_00905 [Acidobacteria bacterium]|nr:hypothetical protein [Acidobacteriota bacterium]
MKRFILISLLLLIGGILISVFILVPYTKHEKDDNGLFSAKKPLQSGS